MSSEKRIHEGQVSPRALDAFLAQEGISTLLALRENSPHTPSLSFPEQFFGEQGTELDGASMGLTQCSPCPFWGCILKATK